MDESFNDTAGLVDGALRAAAHGWHVFPLRPYSKLPAVRNWEQRASTDAGQVRAWWSARPAANIGLACGPAGLVVIDLDTVTGAAHGRDVLARLAAAAGEPVPDTYAVATPSGEHRYFAAPAGVPMRNTAGVWAGVDTRAAGGYVVGPGSLIRVAGQVRCYRVVRHVPVVPLPGWLAAALTRAPAIAATGTPGRLTPPSDPARVPAYVAAAVAGEAQAVSHARTGTRNHTLFRAAVNLGQLVGAGLLDEATAEEALLAAAARHVGFEGFTNTEAHRTVSNGLRRGVRNPRRPIA
jgi:hypothetical protein